MKKFNTESILEQFALVEKSLTRAKLPFETDMTQPEIIEVTLYELIKSYAQIENLVREIDPDRFGKKLQQVPRMIEPALSVNSLRLCPHCGDPKCGSDHK